MRNSDGRRRNEQVIACIPTEDITAGVQAPKYSSEDHKCWGKSKVRIEIWGADKDAPGQHLVPRALKQLGFRLARPEAEGVYVFYTGPEHVDIKSVRNYTQLVEVRIGYKYDGGKDARRLVPVNEIGTGRKMLVSPLKLFYTREI